MDAKRIIGTTALLNVPDILLIGLMALLFIFSMHVLTSGWHRMTLWRVTGSAASPQPMQSAPAEVVPETTMQTFMEV
jgi:hypothetical protein